MSASINFQPINQSFSGNMGAMRMFNQRIGGFADEQDKNLIQKVSKVLAANLELEASDIEKELLEWVFPDDSSEVEDIEKIKKGIQEMETYQSDSELRKTILQWEKSHPQQSSELLFVFQSVLKNPPAQGIILRRSAIVTLVSLFETLLSQLIHSYYSQYPSSLSEDKTLNLSEIRNAGSVQEVEKILIGREAETVIRGNINGQLAYFEKRLGVDVSPLKACKEALNEVLQRRNLFVHNDGVVNHVYLSRTIFAKANSLKEGQRLKITREYLDQAIDAARLFGTILLQQCWRKWLRDKIETADKALNESLVDALVEERYDLTKKMAVYAGRTKLVSKESEYAIVINHAIALKEMGERDTWRKLIRELELSPGNLPMQFRIAVHAIRDEKEKACSLLAKAVASGDINLQAKNWPVFKHMRNEKDFIEIFERGRVVD